MGYFDNLMKSSNYTVDGINNFMSKVKDSTLKDALDYIVNNFADDNEINERIFNTKDYTNELLNDLLSRQIVKDNNLENIRNKADIYDYTKNNLKTLGNTNESPKVFEMNNSDKIKYNSSHYNPNTNTILINPDVHNNSLLSILDHEGGHWLDNKYFNDEINKRKLIKDLLDGDIHQLDKLYPNDKDFIRKYQENKILKRNQHKIPEAHELERINNYKQAINPNYKTNSLFSDDYGINEYELVESGHHYYDNPLHDMSGVPRLPEVDRRKSWEMRRLLQYISKNGFLKGLSGLSSVSNLPGAIKDYYEASKDPNFTDEEKQLRIMNTIQPNEEMEKNIEFLKKYRQNLEA